MLKSNTNRLIMLTAFLCVLMIGFAMVRTSTTIPDQNAPGALRSYYAPNVTYKNPNLIMDLKEGPLPVGIDHKKIDQAIMILEKKQFVSSLLIMHKGILVKEHYFNHFSRTDAQNIHSASKSIISALVGIALDKHYLHDLDDSIALYLPADYFVGDNSLKKAITLRHLLTMTSGLEWHEDSTEHTIDTYTDWAKAILDQKLIHPPGQFYTYSTGNTQLLAEILTRATRMDLKTFGDKYLFSKLGITVDEWRQDPKGTYSGGCNFFITPYEMAKFGQLYLNKGMWDGEQIVPKKWVEASTEDLENYHKLFPNNWYGYCWRIKKIGDHEIYTAWGFAGQMIHIVPDLDLVVVATTESDDYRAMVDDAYSFASLETFIIPAFEASMR